MTLIFETHATSTDNEAGLASGHYDAPLSARGEREARELGERRAGQNLHAIFCSDLQRSYRTAENAFPGREIHRDSRLRECHYGEYTRRIAEFVYSKRLEMIDEPFPGGESYTQVKARVRGFLDEIIPRFRAGTILVIGHRATWYSIESLAKGISLFEVAERAWEWIPGWTYSFDAAQRND
jgi:broad specificity phosphatase PhoE